MFGRGASQARVMLRNSEPAECLCGTQLKTSAHFPSLKLGLDNWIIVRASLKDILRRITRGFVWPFRYPVFKKNVHDLLDC